MAERPPTLPAWADALRTRYLAGESSLFLLHGNVRDLQPWTDPTGVTRWVPLRTFLARFLGRTKDRVVTWSASEGLSAMGGDAGGPPGEALRWGAGPPPPPNQDPARVAETALLRHLNTRRLFRGEPERAELPTRTNDVLSVVEEVLTDPTGRSAVVLDYVETLAPTGAFAHLIESDRANIVTLQRLGGDPTLLASDNLLLLVTESLTDLTPRLAASPHVAALEVPYPDEATRRAFLGAQDLVGVQLAIDLDALARIAAGLTLTQLRGVLRMARQGGTALDFAAINARKKALIEQSCAGLVELVAPEHGFDAVGGMEGVKEELLRVAVAIRAGERGRVPMGLLFVGPMGTGKTYVAEAFARESGLTCLKLKGFRDRWVGSTEANLERVLGLIDALGYVLLVIDEADRSLGGSSGDTDGGTSSRVIARLKEFMSDTRHRGRVLVVMMTNRPDKIDADIKRPGRLDVKIPFFFPESEGERTAIAQAAVRKAGVQLAEDANVAVVARGTAGRSAAEVEAVILAAANFAAWDDRSAVTLSDLDYAVQDVIPSRDTRMLAYMELLAVFEASSRRMLPPRYLAMPTDEVQARLDSLRAHLGARVA